MSTVDNQVQVMHERKEASAPPGRLQVTKMSENLPQLKVCLQILALPVTAQIRLLPGSVGRAATLTQAFEEAYLATRSELAASLTLEQETVLARLSSNLCRMTRQDGPSAWSDEALRTCAGWREVRKGARRALLAFGWSLQLPSTSAMKAQRNGDQRYVQWEDVRYPHGLLY